MKTNFLKSITAGVALIGLTSACSMFGAKDSSHKCAAKNSCNAKAEVKDDAHKCAAKADAAKAPVDATTPAVEDKAVATSKESKKTAK